MCRGETIASGVVASHEVDKGGYRVVGIGRPHAREQVSEDVDAYLVGDEDNQRDADNPKQCFAPSGAFVEVEKQEGVEGNPDEAAGNGPHHLVEEGRVEAVDGEKYGVVDVLERFEHEAAVLLRLFVAGCWHWIAGCWLLDGDGVVLAGGEIVVEALEIGLGAAKCEVGVAASAEDCARGLVVVYGDAFSVNVPHGVGEGEEREMRDLRVKEVLPEGELRCKPFAGRGGGRGKGNGGRTAAHS